MNGRIGLGANFFILSAPIVGVNALLSKKLTFLEVGLYAVQAIYTLENSVEWMFNPTIGYRKIVWEKFVGRIAFSPVLA